MLWIQLAIVLACIVVGARLGGLGLGVVPGLGLLVLVWGFGNAPGGPPIDVLLIIVAVVSAAATLQAAGGLDLLVLVADRLLRRKPEWITFVGPLVSYAFTFGAGTGHVAYSILPVIAEVSRTAGVRPERPLSISVIASQMAITASPLTAATAGMIALLSAARLEQAGMDPALAIGLGDILMVCVPATLIGTLLGALSVMRRGPELADDPEYQRRLASGEMKPPVKLAELAPVERSRARTAVAIFLGAACLVVLIGLVPALRPSEPRNPEAFLPVANWFSGLPETVDARKPQPVSMVATIQIVMLCAAAAMMLFAKASPDKAVRGSIMRAGIVAVVSILGIAWLGECFIGRFQTEVVGGIAAAATAAPWTFAVGLFAPAAVRSRHSRLQPAQKRATSHKPLRLRH